MPRNLLILSLIAGASFVAIQPAARGQDSPEAKPSLSDRLDRFRRNLMGSDADERQPATRSAPIQRRDAVEVAERPAAKASPDAPFEPFPVGNVAAGSRAGSAAQATAASSRRNPLGTPIGRAAVTQPQATASQPSARRSATPISPAAPQGEQFVESAAARGIDPYANRQPVGSSVANPATFEPRMARNVAPPTVPPAAAEASPSTPVENTDLVITRTSPVIIVETAGPSRILIGKPASYKVTIKNAGEAAANDVLVSVAIPDWAEVADAIATTGNMGRATDAASDESFQWRLRSLAPRTQEDLTLEIVPHRSEAFDLAVRWTHSPVASQTTVEVQEPKLELSLAGAKEVLFGEKQLYKISISNPGNGEARNVVIHLLPLSGDRDSVASHRIGAVAAGATKVVEVELVARQSGTVMIQAEATADDGLEAKLAEEVTVRQAALAVAVEGPAVQYAGVPGRFVVRVRNTGDAPARSVQVACKLPPEAEFRDADREGRFEPSERGVLWSLGELAAGAEETFIVQCLLQSPGDNRFDAAAIAAGDLRHSSTTSTRVEQVADLALDLTDPAGPVPVGTEVAYELRVRNRGTKAAEGIEITGYFSNGIEPVSVEGARYELSPGAVVMQPIERLGAGQDAVITIRARADSAGNHQFRAELSCKPLGAKLTQQESTLFYGDTIRR